MTKVLGQTIFTVADEMILELSISDEQLVVEERAVKLTVNGQPAAGFTLIRNGKRYYVNVTE